MRLYEKPKLIEDLPYSGHIDKIYDFFNNLPRKKLLKDLTAADIPPGLDPEDVAIDYQQPLRPRKFVKL